MGTVQVEPRRLRRRSDTAGSQPPADATGDHGLKPQGKAGFGINGRLRRVLDPLGFRLLRLVFHVHFGGGLRRDVLGHNLGDFDRCWLGIGSAACLQPGGLMAGHPHQ